VTGAVGPARQDVWQALRAVLADVWDLEQAAAVLAWDRQVNMPAEGGAARTEQEATLARLAHERFTSPVVGELLAQLGAEGPDPLSLEGQVLAATRRAYERALLVPTRLVERLAAVSGRAYGAWLDARRERRFEIFAPALEEVVDVNREIAAAVGVGDDPYDSLLHLREPGVTVARLEELFARLKDTLVPLRAAIAAQPGADEDTVLRGPFDPARQMALCRNVVQALGFDFCRGRLDQSVHPFETSFDVDDVRLTTRFDPRDLLGGLYGAIHETGHGLYEQGLPREGRRTPLGRAMSTGVHESQSRLWENLVGRSRPFCRFLLPHLRAVFPELPPELDEERLYRTVNRVRSSPIRVEADEVTYNLHILLRFELERALLSRELPVDDVPAAWAEGMERYLGIRPRDDLEGSLQDIHWSGGDFGYFPSYTLGNVLAAELFEAAAAELGGLEEELGRGEFGPLLSWLREHLHRHGSAFTMHEWLKRELGRDLDPEPYLRYITGKYRALYGLA
jgi:carboxypeptidase Taq